MHSRNVPNRSNDDIIDGRLLVSSTRIRVTEIRVTTAEWVGWPRQFCRDVPSGAKYDSNMFSRLTAYVHCTN